MLISPSVRPMELPGSTPLSSAPRACSEYVAEELASDACGSCLTELRGTGAQT
jgi:hypothetical protein